MNPNNQLNPNKWIENYGDALFAFIAKRISNNTEQAEDILQDVFLSAWRNRESYNGTASEKTWLYTICKNKIIDFYRKDSKVKNVAIADDKNDDIFFSDDGHFTENYMAKNDWSNNGSNALQQKEFYNILNQCKKKLKQIQEQVFSMKYLDDIDSEEICTLLGISNQNYWVLIHRAKIQLRTCLEKNWINS